MTTGRAAPGKLSDGDRLEGRACSRAWWGKPLLMCVQPLRTVEENHSRQLGYRGERRLRRVWQTGHRLNAY